MVAGISASAEDMEAMVVASEAQDSEQDTGLASGVLAGHTGVAPAVLAEDTVQE